MTPTFLCACLGSAVIMLSGKEPKRELEQELELNQSWGQELDRSSNRSRHDCYTTNRVRPGRTRTGRDPESIGNKLPVGERQDKEGRTYSTVAADFALLLSSGKSSVLPWRVCWAMGMVKMYRRYGHTQHYTCV
ncbi:hypothetical protein LX32DRAFT_687917, partial [Colletotrichum zoysiae]